MSRGQPKARVTKIRKLTDTARPVEGVLVMLAGPKLGERYTLSGASSFVIGRDEGNFIVVDMDSVSRKHCEIVVRDNKLFVRDLGSTNGTYLNDEELHDEQPLRSGDLLKVERSVFKYYWSGAFELNSHKEIYELSIRDGLTQLYNRRGFLQELERNVARSSRVDEPLSVLLLGFDRFQGLGENVGQMGCEHFLRELAKRLSKCVEGEGVLARYSDEELIYVRQGVSAEAARRLGAAMKRAAEDQPFTFKGVAFSITLSIGVVTCLRPLWGEQELIERCTRELRRARAWGGHCISMSIERPMNTWAP